MEGTLSLVATPIGNLEDITLRAIRTLKEADLVLCESTLHARKLLSHYNISTPTTIFFSKTHLVQQDKIINELLAGKHLALISDAGTPCISDPGSLLVSRLRSEFPQVKIEIIPGPSALTAAVALSGLPGNSFVFYGFLPHKKGRNSLFQNIKDSTFNSVFYESVHRIEKTLGSLKDIDMGERKIIVARELTKLHEEVVAGNAQEVRAFFEKNNEKRKGEFVVLVEGAK